MAARRPIPRAEQRLADLGSCSDGDDWPAFAVDRAEKGGLPRLEAQAPARVRAVRGAKVRADPCVEGLPARHFGMVASGKLMKSCETLMADGGAE